MKECWYRLRVSSAVALCYHRPNPCHSSLLKTSTHTHTDLRIHLHLHYLHCNISLSFKPKPRNTAPQFTVPGKLSVILFHTLSYLHTLSLCFTIIVFYNVQSSQLAARVVINDLLTHLLTYSSTGYGLMSCLTYYRLFWGYFPSQSLDWCKNPV